MAKKRKAKKKGFAKFLKDERFHKITGIFCLFLALYLTIAFISYFFTWTTDQDKVLQHSWGILFNGEVTVDNWLGRFGAIVSNSFFYWGFGIASFGVVLILVKLGLDLLKKNPLSSSLKFAVHTILSMALIAIVLEFFFASSGFSWGGVFGHSIFIWMTHFVGRLGLFLFIVLILMGTTVWFINPAISPALAGVEMPDVKTFNLPKFDFFKSALSGGYFESLEIQQGKEQEESKGKPGNDQSIWPDEREAARKTNTSGFAEAGEEIQMEIPDVPKPRKKPAVLEALELEMVNTQAEAEVEIEQNSAPETTGDTAPVDAKPGVPDLPFETVEEVKEPVKILPVQEEEELAALAPYDPTKDLSEYEYPDLELLEDYADRKVTIDRAELEANKNQIVETLSHYKISITGIRATIGPTVTLYEIIPQPGTKIKSIKNLENDIALSLAALGIRIIAPIPGKGTIGIEVPNKKKNIVSLKEVLKSEKFLQAKMALPVALGKTISNEIFIADLAKMPHLLIAGATGQGKSVGINTILMSLLYKQHPSKVKIVMIDPKKVELFPYSKLDKHFLSFLPDQEEPIITDTTKAIHTLNSLTIEMDSRYDLLKKARVRNIKEYNKKFVERQLNPNNGHKYMPYIVLVIDEFADLIMTAGKEIELPIARLAQLSRAIGIHLIIATQRPTTNIITGMIKANFPARVSYKVTSQVDSRTILDHKGAEQLVGMGDMLFSIGADLVRIQCAFVDTPEVERVIDHIDAQQCYPEPYYLPEVAEEGNISNDGGNLKWSDLDSMFEDAARLVVANQHGSTSMIQRKLQLGYNRAGRIMDQMHALGIVGDTNGSKPREVLFHTEVELMQYFDHLKKR